MDGVLDKDARQEAEELQELWLERLRKEKSAHEKFRKEAEKAFKAYSNKARQRFNILWSNVQIQKGATFSDSPNPEVRRRVKDMGGQDVQKRAAQIIERALDYVVDSTNFDFSFGRVVDDYLTAGLGVPRVRYSPSFGTRTIGEGEMTQEVEYIADQKLWVEYMPWSSFHWMPCANWELCDWIAFKFTKPKDWVKEKYKVTVDDDEEAGEDHKEVKLYEIWDRKTKTIITICEQFKIPLEVRQDKLNLQDFYRVPRVLMTNVCDRLIPKPDYEYYCEDAEQLNRLKKRQDAIIKSIKNVGFYDAYMAELKILEKKPDGALVPVKDLMEKLGENPDLDRAIAYLPVEHAAAVMVALRQESDDLKQEIYEVIGLSDIMRGASKATETAEAQGIKAQFGSIRLSDKQKAVAYGVRDVFRLMAEIIGEHYQPEILTMMTGVQADDAVMEVLRSDVLRNLSINVETESTIARDEQAERGQRMESLQIMSDYLVNLLPQMMSGQIPFEMGKELLLMAVRGHKYVGNLEDAIENLSQDNVVAQLQQQIAQMGEQMQALQQQAQKANQVDMADKAADIGKKQAETRKTHSEATEQDIENAANTRALQFGGPMVATG